MGLLAFDRGLGTAAAAAAVMLGAADCVSPVAQRTRKVSTGLTGLRRVSSLLSSKGRSSSSRPRRETAPPSGSWADDLDPVLAQARWAAEAAAHTPRTAREMMAQCPVEPSRAAAAPEPSLATMERATAAQQQLAAEPSAAEILRCHRSRTPSPVGGATAAASGLTDCTCEYSNAELRCVHLFEVTGDGADGTRGAHAEFGGSSQSRGSFTLPTAPISYAAAREHLDAQLGARLPAEYVFVRGGIPVGKKQELKWLTLEAAVVIKAKEAAGFAAPATFAPAPPAPPATVMPWGDDVMEMMAPAEPAVPTAGAVFGDQAPADGAAAAAEELRIDEEDGQAYSRDSFIEAYGYEDGLDAWRTALVTRPAAALAPAPAPAAVLGFGSLDSSSFLEAQAMYPGITLTAPPPPVTAPPPTIPAAMASGFGRVPAGLSVADALSRVPWSVPYGRVISV